VNKTIEQAISRWEPETESRLEKHRRLEAGFGGGGWPDAGSFARDVDSPAAAVAVVAAVMTVIRVDWCGDVFWSKRILFSNC
jgi:hypothetical protein